MCEDDDFKYTIVEMELDDLPIIPAQKKHVLKLVHEDKIVKYITELKLEIEREIEFRKPDEEGYRPHKMDRLRSVERQYLKRDIIRRLEDILGISKNL